MENVNDILTIPASLYIHAVINSDKNKSAYFFFLHFLFFYEDLKNQNKRFKTYLNLYPQRPVRCSALPRKLMLWWGGGPHFTQP